jgi:hypothetical protein
MNASLSESNSTLFYDTGGRLATFRVPLIGLNLNHHNLFSSLLSMCSSQFILTHSVLFCTSPAQPYRALPLKVRLLFFFTTVHKMDPWRRNSPVSTVIGVRIEWPGSRGWIPGKGNKIVSSLQRSDRLWSPPCFKSNGYRRVGLRLKQPRRQADHSLHSRGKVKNVWSCTPILSYCNMYSYC